MVTHLLRQKPRRLLRLPRLLLVLLLLLLLLLLPLLPLLRLDLRLGVSHLSELAVLLTRAKGEEPSTLGRPEAGN